MFKLWEENRFSFPVGKRWYMCTYFYQYAPLPLYVHFMGGLWSCIWCTFFLRPENLDTIKYSMPTTFFIHFVLPPAPFPQKNFNVSTHCKAVSRHAVAIPLRKTYCSTCFYSYIKFFCRKVRWSWVLWGKK